MITIDDCIAMCGLEEEVVAAIAEHENCPEIIACAKAYDLMRQEHGAEAVRDIIIDDIRAAQGRSDREHVQHLLHVLHHFLRSHPEAVSQWRD